MHDTRADLILHPLRMRILKTLDSQQRSAAQLLRAMPDVPRATLYRHLNKLVDAGILTITEAPDNVDKLEKVYQLSGEGAGFLSRKDMDQATREDHRRYFRVFVTSVLNDFERYLATKPETGELDLKADGVGYQVMPVYVTPEELQHFASDLNAVLIPYMENQPSPDRQRIMLSLILIPSSDADSDD